MQAQGNDSVQRSGKPPTDLLPFGHLHHGTAKDSAPKQCPLAAVCGDWKSQYMKKRNHRNSFKNSSKQTLALAVSRLQNVYEAGKQWQIAWRDACNPSKGVPTGSANVDLEDTDAGTALGRLETLAFDRNVASAKHMREILHRDRSGQSGARILVEWDGDFKTLTPQQLFRLRDTLRGTDGSGSK